MNKWERVYVTHDEHIGDQSMRAYTSDDGFIWLWLGNNHGLSLAPDAAQRIIALLQRELDTPNVVKAWVEESEVTP